MNLEKSLEIAHYPNTLLKKTDAVFVPGAYKNRQWLIVTPMKIDMMSQTAPGVVHALRIICMACIAILRRQVKRCRLAIPDCG